MEIKKSPHADLRKTIPLSLAMGLVLALGILYTALEWTSTKDDSTDDMTALNIADMEDALIINEQQQEQPEPEPEAPQEVVE